MRDAITAGLVEREGGQIALANFQIHSVTSGYASGVLAFGHETAAKTRALHLRVDNQ